MSRRRVEHLLRKLNRRHYDAPATDVEHVAERLASFRHPTLSSRARARIWQAAQARAASLPARRTVRPRLAWAALPLVLLFFLSSTSVVMAAQSSLPSEALYPFKSLSEQVWFTLTPEAQRPAVALELATRRIAEVGQLNQRGEVAPAGVLEDLEAYLTWIDQMPAGEPARTQALYRLSYEIQALEEQAQDLPLNSSLLLALAACRRTQIALANPSGFEP
ncbi:MAG: hypothetical protein JXD18_09545 [Anaerolineae bacterium]|nr:hypothetical protein [Anaerolineae bacterium]